MHVAGERCVRAGGPEDRIGEIILHVGGIGVQVVQVQLLHTVVGLIIHVLTEVQFEGIPVGILIGSNEGETGISFGCKGNLTYGFTVDGDICLILCFLRGIGFQVLPVLFGDLDVDLMHIGGVEDLLGIGGVCDLCL